MKKFLILSALVSLLSSQSFAKSGHTISIEGSRFDVDQEFANANFLGSDDKVLATVGYGYKFQLSQFFIRPSAFYNIGEIDIQDTDGTNDKSTFNPTVSVEGDFGYDFNDNFGVFGTLGLLYSNLERKVGNTTSDASNLAPLFGVGLEYNVIPELRLTAKYQYSESSYGVQNYTEDFEVESKIIRVGVAYNF